MKCGIEIHQQLNTNKLFCKCPNRIRDDKPDIVFTRKLRAVAGETGQIDVAAAQEQSRDMIYTYEAYSDSTCLIEADEEPPMPMNPTALDVVIEIGKMLNAKFVDEIQVMRKTVVNGSNTSGFQRTALVCTDAFLDTPQGKVGIPTICIEEDAARDIERKKHNTIYRLDRLGIPLIELATDPDITSPEQAKEVAQQIGMILRSTGKVMRGIGTIRQDVNVSVPGGTRVEIKGAQDLKMIPELVRNEVMRQESLIEIKKTVKNMDISLIRDSKDVTELLKGTESKLLSKAECIMGISIPKFKGIIGIQLQPGRRLGSEFSDYAKIKAGVGGIIHSDEDLAKYGLSEKEIKKINSTLLCKQDDAFVLVTGTLEQCTIALEAVKLRAKLCKEGVLKEVRKPNADGTTSFMRPMPGAARMYPETDIPPIKLTKSRIKTIKTGELLTDKSKRYSKTLGLPNDLATIAAKSSWFDLDKKVLKYPNVKPLLIAEAALVFPKEIKRRHKKDLDIEKNIDLMLEKLNSGEINNEAVFELLVEVAHGKKPDFSKYTLVSDDELEDVVEEIISKNKSAPFGALMGMVMNRFRGKADGKKVAELVKKHS